MAENNAVLSNEEKARILYHLGYTVVNAVSIFTLGVPAVGQPLYLAYSMLDRIPESSLQQVRRIVVVLDKIEQAKIDGLDYLVASQIDGEIQIDDRLQDKLDVEYTKWAQKLSDATAAPLSPYSARFGLGGMRSMNYRRITQ